ncbi:hypothetical protein [Flavobacterium sp.]|uniref:hypothetical protein n=1 Tax=Flavobacterium sp. TaxID=239 RepID=UPI00286B0B0D|nr:hypothetical protein [Flavobacterium sp.]
MNISKKADVFQIVEEEKKQLSLFFCNKKTTRCLRFDEHFTIVDSIASDRPSSASDNIVGYSLSENNYYAYWAGSNNKEILGQCFDFNAKKVSEKSFHLEFEKEKVITRITIDNVFYVVSIVKNTSVLNFYMFKNGILEKKSIDLSNKRFLDSKSKPAPLWDLVSGSTSFEGPFSFQTIASDTPPSLALSANKRKLYVFGNSVVFSMDINKNFTQTFTVNLLDFSVNQKVYSQPFFEGRVPNPDDNLDTYYLAENTSSFMLKDAIVQIKAVDNVIKISAKNLNGDELKSFKISAVDYINFKNSAIYQENGSVKSLKTVENSSQFAKKMSDLNPSLSIYQSNGRLCMVVGGVSLVQQNDGIMIGGMIGGFTGALIGAALTSNYYLDNLNSYKNRNVVYANCLFDKDFNHLDGDAQKTAFDVLRGFAEKNEELTSATILKLNSNLYYGGYDIKNKTYSFYKFND